ncbi:ETX/MTX2 family pore-forming toxin [Bacillus thuringiensis]|uniref:Uncharacterized protein n=1 Tax=Bacillus thuringiensis TaxID=1428 RepID=A0AAW4I0P2_BACTU|nr:ETX/MTX2 family pore-forming toxin [Bacillus thuringiensis]MBN9901656.1 hypothetical protein [Bacillus thuringiensis]MDY7522121.1 ETX/MTX2 family pore-forming toxin [Bacillus thuringiensis]
MNKTKFKKNMVALMLTTSIGIPCVSAPGSVLAAENTPTNVNENVRVGITDIQSELKKIGEYYYANEISGTQIKEGSHVLTFEYKPRSVETKVDFNITGTVNDLKFDTTVVKYVGDNIFDNTEIDIPQDYTTGKYTESVTESTTTTVTNGFKVGGSGDGSNIFTIPLLLNNGMKINAEFNSSTTNSKTKSETKTIEASAQKITVPAHKKYKVDVLLEHRNFWGDVTFTGSAQDPITTIVTKAGKVNMGGSIIKEYTFKDLSGSYYNKLTNSQKNNIEGLEFINLFPGPSNILKAKGTAKVEGIFGSVLTVKTYDITDESNPKLVETKSFN